MESKYGTPKHNESITPLFILFWSFEVVPRQILPFEVVIPEKPEHEGTFHSVQTKDGQAA